MTTLQINDIVREALDFVEHDLRDNGISLTTEFPDNLPEIYADHTQIQQIVFNLIKNAIEAMRSCSSDKRSLRVATAGGNSYVSFYIQDSGPELAQGIGIAYSIHFLRRNKTVPDWGSPSAGRSSSVTAASCDLSRATFAVPFLRLQFLLAHRPPFRAELEYQCLLLTLSGHPNDAGAPESSCRSGREIE